MTREEGLPTTGFRRSWPLLVLPLAFGLVTAASWVGYVHQKSVVRQRSLENLETITHFEASLIDTWFRQNLLNAANGTDELVARVFQKEDLERSESSREKIRDALEAYSAGNGFAASGLLDTEGRWRLWSRSGDEGQFCSHPLDRKWLPLYGPTASNLHLSDLDREHIDFVVALSFPDEKTQPQNYAVFVLDAKKSLFPVLLSGPRNTLTGETLLIQRHAGMAEYASPTRFGNYAPLSIRTVLAKDQPARQALECDRAQGEGIDYRGRRILYATQHIPRIGWGIVSKVDQSEAYATLAYSASLAWGFTLCSLLAAVLAIYGLWSRRYTRVTAGLIEILERQKAALETTLRKLFRVQEEERLRLSHELHDCVVRKLSHADLELAYLMSDLPSALDGTTEERVLTIKDALGEASSECRQIISRFRPPELDIMGLSQAIRALAGTLGPMEVFVGVEESDTLNSLPPEVSMTLYRIAQEALVNVRKHSGAKFTKVVLETGPEGILLVIEDDGRGIEMGKYPAPLHFGLDGMRERAQFIGAVFTLRTGPGKGTCISVRWRPQESEYRSEMSDNSEGNRGHGC